MTTEYQGVTFRCPSAAERWSRSITAGLLAIICPDARPRSASSGRARSGIGSEAAANLHEIVMEAMCQTDAAQCSCRQTVEPHPAARDHLSGREGRSTPRVVASAAWLGNGTSNRAKCLPRSLRGCSGHSYPNMSIWGRNPITDVRLANEKQSTLSPGPIQLNSIVERLVC